MSTNNICFHGEIRKIFSPIPFTWSYALSQKVSWALSEKLTFVFCFVKNFGGLLLSFETKLCVLSRTDCECEA